ncbi:hypothetical protein EsH8_VIII_000718 [Colletotrichum jinshuiense]
MAESIDSDKLSWLRQPRARSTATLPLALIAGMSPKSDNVYIEAQNVGKDPSVCDANSDLSRGYRECISCIEANANASKATVDAYIELKFRPFLEYCASPTSRPSYPSSLMTVRTVTQFADITAFNGKIQSGVLHIWTVTELKAEVTSPGIATSKTVSLPTASSNETTPAGTSATDIQVPPGEISKAWIAGPVIGIITAIMLVLAGLWLLRRRRKQGLDRFAVGNNEDAKEEFIRAQLHSDCVPRHIAMELEGSYPKAIPEMSANEIPAGEMPISNGQHTEQMTGRNS